VIALLTISEAAEALRVSVRTVEREISDGRLIVTMIRARPLNAEHSRWSRMGLDGDHRAEMGRGYLDGLAGSDPVPNAPGRPKEIESGRRVNAWLDQASVDRAEALGDGNVSAGIRAALSASFPSTEIKKWK